MTGETLFSLFSFIEEILRHEVCMGNEGKKGLFLFSNCKKRVKSCFPDVRK